MTDVDIVAFLRARLDDIERIARSSDDGLCPNPGWPGMWSSGEYPYVCVEPALVLREVGAKRRIVDEHLPRRPGFTRAIDGETPEQTARRHRLRTDQVCSTCLTRTGRVVAPCPTLRLLAAVYDQHPDYREEWRP